MFFIDLVNDIWEEVNVAYVRLNAGNPGNYVDHPVRQLGNNIVASSGPSGIATISMAFVVATSVAASNTNRNSDYSTNSHTKDRTNFNLFNG